MYLFFFSFMPSQLGQTPSYLCLPLLTISDLENGWMDIAKATKDFSRGTWPVLDRGQVNLQTLSMCTVQFNFNSTTVQNKQPKDNEEEKKHPQKLEEPLSLMCSHTATVIRFGRHAPICDGDEILNYYTKKMCEHHSNQLNRCFWDAPKFHQESIISTMTPSLTVSDYMLGYFFIIFGGDLY